MRVIVSTLLPAVLLLLASAAQAQNAPAASPEPLEYVRIYADSSGASHFADAEMPLALVDPGQGIPPTPAAAPIPGTGLMMLCPPPGAFVDWHPAPRRQYNLMLSGTVEVEVSDGTRRRFGAGNVLLVEDTTGQGHRTRVLSNERACFAAVPVPPGASE